MATISEALAMAVQHHQAGRLQAAEQIYRQILAVEPNHADAGPWYPTMRLFRQDKRGDWQGVFGRIAVALGEEMASQGICPNDDS
jgi:hypothetical protein